MPSAKRGTTPSTEVGRYAYEVRALEYETMGPMITIAAKREPMRPREDIEYMFHHIKYTKSSDEIRERMKEKVVALKAKIQERKGRIAKIREEFKISDKIYIDLLEQAREAQKKGQNRMSYSISNSRSSDDGGGLQESDELVIGAGTVNALLTESDFIKSETAEAKKLELISRNIKDEETDWSGGRKLGHTLSEAELEYLGF